MRGVANGRPRGLTGWHPVMRPEPQPERRNSGAVARRTLVIGVACVLWVGIVGGFVALKVREFSRMRDTARRPPPHQTPAPVPSRPQAQRPTTRSLASLSVAVTPTPAELEAKARAGDAEAALQLARTLELQGAGRAGPMKVAFESRLRAAELGSGLAMAGLARAYRAGIGVEPDAALAESWTERAVATGGAEQWHRIGLAFQAGSLLPADAREATAWFERAAAENHAGARTALQQQQRRAAVPSAGPRAAGASPSRLADELTQIFDISLLDATPRATFQVRPRYPFELRRQRISGEVLVEFFVDREGNVRDAFAVRSTEAGFEEAAVAAVSTWRFEPGRKNGAPVITRMRVPIVFSMNEDPVPASRRP